MKFNFEKKTESKGTKISNFLFKGKFEMILYVIFRLPRQSAAFFKMLNFSIIKVSKGSRSKVENLVFFMDLKTY